MGDHALQSAAKERVHSNQARARCFPTPSHHLLHSFCVRCYFLFVKKDVFPLPPCSRCGKSDRCDRVTDMLEQLLQDLKGIAAPISFVSPEYIEGGFHVVQFEVSGQKLEVIQRIVDWDRGGRSREKVNVYCAAEAGEQNWDSVWFDGRSQDPLVMHRSIMCIKEEDGKKQYLHKWQPGKMWDLFFGGPKEDYVPPPVEVYQVGGGTAENGRSPAGAAAAATWQQ